MKERKIVLKRKKRTHNYKYTHSHICRHTGTHGASKIKYICYSFNNHELCKRVDSKGEREPKAKEKQKQKERERAREKNTDGKKE